MKYEELTKQIIGSAFEVLNELGVGFLESVYENALIRELKKNGLAIEKQKKLNVYYKEELVGVFYADILVENKVILELKVVNKIQPEHQAQLINYLRATGLQVGLLLNFGNAKLDFKRVHINK